MLPSLSSMEKWEVRVFAHNKERTGFDVLIEVEPGRYTQGVLTINAHHVPLPEKNG